MTEEVGSTVKEQTESLQKGTDHHERQTVAPTGDAAYPAAALLDDLWENKTFRVSDSDGPSGPVRLRVETHGSVSLMMDFFRDLRRSPNMRLDRMAGMEVWLRLNDRLRLEEYLLEMDSVASVRMHDSNLEVGLAYPLGQFVPDGSDGSAVVESTVVQSRHTARAEAVAAPSADAVEGAP